MNSSSFSLSMRGILLVDSRINITNSIFSELGSFEIDGGAIFIKDSEGLISNCTFHANKAKRGGSIMIDCKKNCKNSIYDSTFESNNAKTKGGSIDYNRDTPIL